MTSTTHTRDAATPWREARVWVVPLATFGAIAWPRAAPILLALVALVWLAGDRPLWRDLRDLKDSAARDPLIWGTGLFVAYLAINASWAVKPAAALEKVALFAAFAALTLATVRAMARALEDQIGRAGAGLALAVMAGATLLLIEILTGHGLTRALLNAVPVLRPDSGKHFVVDNGHIVSIGIYALNRNIGAAVLLLWPALLAATRLRQAWLRMAAIAMMAAAMLAVFWSEHASSMVALLVSAAIFGVFRLAPRLVRSGMVLLWWGAFVLAIPLSLALYKAEWHLADWLPTTAQARVILWHTTSQGIAEAPILGHGIRSTQIEADSTIVRIRPKDFAYPVHTGRHAHNIYLQAWYELGLVGVVLLAVLGTIILRRLDKLAPVAQAFAYAHFGAFMAIAAFSWGLWQTWYMAAIALGALFMALAARDGGRAAPGLQLDVDRRHR